MDDDIHYIFLGYVVDTKSIRSENESNYNMHKQIKHTHIRIHIDNWIILVYFHNDYDQNA